MRIRTATLEDAAAMCVYAAALFAEKLPGIFNREAPTIEEEREYISGHIDPANSTLLIAEEGGEILGMIGLEGGTRAEEVHSGTIAISVARDHRGHGVGTALIEAMLEWAPAHGVARVALGSWSNNPRAAELYRRCGFVDEGVLRGAVRRDGEVMDVIMLAKQL